MTRIRRICLTFIFFLALSLTYVSSASTSSVTFRNAPSFVQPGQPFEFIVQVRTQPDDVVLTVALVDGSVPLVLSQVNLQQNTQPQHHFTWSMRESGEFNLIATITNTRYQITARKVVDVRVLDR